MQPAARWSAVAAGCPNIAATLKLQNQRRAQHRTPSLTWDAGLAASAQAYANQCVWSTVGSPGSNWQGDTPPLYGENRFYSYGRNFPILNMDVCTYAIHEWYHQITNYRFEQPGRRWYSDVDTNPLTQLLWGETRKVGCGYAKCAPLANMPQQGWAQADFVVCHYQVAGNFYWADDPSNPDYSPYAGNVKRATCQANTRDDWCSACGRQGATWACTACFPRMALHQKPVIRLDAASKRCVSDCMPGQPTSLNCAACTVEGTCMRCKTGWLFDTAKRFCSVAARKPKSGRR
ncbi:hypothetical protein CHLNCDRAFT_49781 [Chlorella variabilis]|uniref:SCP domain-containing protein n=1 Tax=Chlorella variabilis TaxID=554065 RepID=E1Z411_CHLVA|nr:hypothetical protein CHLNCDRAFT_49781 [Chlorella variabilis]EFN58971.1 hypothetical protein CHLNCDRAFT_49781 [Chlorella variabilis]|eukprot:XP_005851073.1 hypothetical protein CHLNCDRAFT_49781 [Chlorella variabilis]